MMFIDMVLSEIIPVFLYTVVVSVDCLAILLKDVEDIKSLGVLLGLQEHMLEAIKCYYNNERALINRHVINMWVLSCLQDPIQQLRDALYQLKAIKIAQTLVLLTSIGRFIHLHYHFSAVSYPFSADLVLKEKKAMMSGQQTVAGIKVFGLLK